MTKNEIRSQLTTDTIAFLMKGGVIQEIPAQRKKIKVTCRAKSANTAVGRMGNEPTYNISSIYNREV